MSKKRAGEWEELNLNFTLEVRKSFEERIDELHVRDYKSEYGNCRVPVKFKSNPSLASWYVNLKSSYRLIQEGNGPILKLTEEICLERIEGFKSLEG